MPGERGVVSGDFARTLAVARFLAADVLRSQRYLLPLLVYAAVLGVLFGNDPGPPPGPWAASALALYPLAAWFAVIVANTEDPVQRTVTAAAAGGLGPVVTGTLLVGLGGDALLVVLPVGWPVVLGHHPYPPSVLLLGGVAHLACASAGTAVGLLCARPLVERIGWSFCLGVAIVVVTAVQPWLPPVGVAVRALTTIGPPPVLAAALGLVLAAGAAVVAWVVERRR
jgi:hypothetical protein